MPSHSTRPSIYVVTDVEVVTSNLDTRVGTRLRVELITIPNATARSAVITKLIRRTLDSYGGATEVKYSGLTGSEMASESRGERWRAAVESYLSLESEEKPELRKYVAGVIKPDADGSIASGEMSASQVAEAHHNKARKPDDISSEAPLVAMG